MTIRHLLNCLFIIGLIQVTLWVPSHSLETIISLERATDFICPGEGFYPADDLCGDIYYLCIDGIAYVQVCPPDAVFDPVEETCVSYETASCKTTTTTTTTPSTTTAAPFVCPIPNGEYPVPGTCANEYYTCSNGIPTLSTCPVGETFDPITYVCTPTDEATCNLPFECPGPDGFFTYPEACSGVYFICIKNASYVQYCPEGSVFDPEISSCAVIDAASCTPGPPPTTSTTEGSTTSGPFVCPSDGRFPYEGNCTLYWICVNGIAYVAPCPDGMVYNPNTKLCDFPVNGTIDCNESEFFSEDQIKSRPKDDLIGVDLDFYCPGLGVWPHPIQCELYYTCYFNEPTYLWRCSGNSLFDVDSHECSYPEIIKCGDRIRSANSAITTTSSSFTCSDIDGFYPVDPDTCSSSYYGCIAGEVYFLTCPEDFLFDPATSTCVDPNLCVPP